MKKLIAALKKLKKKQPILITYRYFYIYLVLLFLNLRNAVLNIVKKKYVLNIFLGKQSTISSDIIRRKFSVVMYL